MMNQKIQAVKGMNDILPEQSCLWECFENIVRNWLSDYGYQNIRTPIVENTALFVRSIGEATDIVEKEMYTFTDSLNNDSLTLRPEGTVACLRAAIEHNLLYNNSQRLWYMGPMFRHERPQKGRYRQFHQVGAEALGFKGPDVDAELIAMSYDLWQRLGLADCVDLQINSLGQKDERAKYREALIKHLQKHRDILDEDGKRRMQTNPLRVLDTKTPAMQAMVASAPKLMDYLGEASLQHYQDFKAMIGALGIQYTENLRLVRGLDYYNLSVFEWVTTELGAQGTVCAGGRYDGLIEELGGQATPAVGFALGVERLLLLAESKGSLKVDYAPDVYIAQQGDGAPLYALKTAQKLRAAGFKVLQYAGDAGFKSQMKKADLVGAKFAVIIGKNEIASACLTLKDLRGVHEQISVKAGDIVTQLKTWMV